MTSGWNSVPRCRHRPPWKRLSFGGQKRWDAAIGFFEPVKNQKLILLLQLWLWRIVCDAVFHAWFKIHGFA